jgi:hypothetical protein
MTIVSNTDTMIPDTNKKSSENPLILEISAVKLLVNINSKKKDTMELAIILAVLRTVEFLNLLSFAKVCLSVRLVKFMYQ